LLKQEILITSTRLDNIELLKNLFPQDARDEEEAAFVSYTQYYSLLKNLRLIINYLLYQRDSMSQNELSKRWNAINSTAAKIRLDSETAEILRNILKQIADQF